MIEDRVSYCGLGEVQYKTFLNKKLMKMIIDENGFTPIHAILIPTNECNLKCKFCNCSNRCVSDKLSFEDIIKILDMLRQYDVHSITISGGGEPTLYRELYDVVRACVQRGIEVGLVTNGTRLGDILQYPAGSFAWIRISCGDGRDIIRMEEILSQGNDIIEKKIARRMGISYIVTKSFDSILFHKVANIVEKLKNIEYMKVLCDCTDTTSIVEGDSIEEYSKVIVADPHSYTYDEKSCLLPLIKPFFAADGYVYPCCDIQYHNNSREYSKSMRLCHYSEYPEFVDKQLGFKIEHACSKCFHYTGNMYLVNAKRGIKDGDWI